MTEVQKLDIQTSVELGKVINDPRDFAKGILQHDHWRVANDILISVAKNKRTAVKACHASSKTFTAADAALWWVTRFKDGLVITTAPTWLQVEKLLWGNIKSAALDSKIQFPEALKTYLELGPENYIIGISTDEGVRFQGWHGTILIILDEAPGVLPQIYEAIEGIRSAGKVHVLLLGNPTAPTGPFFDAFSTNRSSWSTFTINAFETPNFEHLYLEDKNVVDEDGKPYLVGVKTDDKFNILDLTEEELDEFGKVRPYLVQPSWVKEKYEEWGKDNPLWESKVLGEFPSGGEEMLIPLSLAESVKELIVNIPDTTQLEAGIDVAGPGEANTTLYIRQAQNLIFSKRYPESDPRARVLLDLATYRDRLKSVKIDSVGNGYYFALGIQDAGYPVIQVNVGEDAKNKKQFTNLKSELYWGLRNRFKQKNIGGIKDDKLISQLSSIKWGPHKTTGKITIESKEEMRSRGAKSPDDAEGLMLCYADVEMLKPKERKKIQPSRSFQTY